MGRSSGRALPPTPGFPVVRLSATSDTGAISVMNPTEQPPRRKRWRRRSDYSLGNLTPAAPGNSHPSGEKRLEGWARRALTLGWGGRTSESRRPQSDHGRPESATCAARSLCHLPAGVVAVGTGASVRADANVGALACQIIPGWR